MEGKGFDILLVNGYVQRKVNLKFLNQGILPWQPKDGWIKQISPGFLTIPLPNCEIQNQCEALETIFINGVRTSERLIVSLPWNLIIPDNKSEEFLQVLQFWPDLLWGISKEQVLVTDSLEVLEKFSGIGPQFKSFLRNFGKFLRFSLKFFPRNSWEIFWNISMEIPEKYLGLGHQFYGFFGELNKRHSLKKFLRKSHKFFLEKFT